MTFMKHLIIPFLVALVFISPNNIAAQAFFDTSEPETFFSLSGRIGFNTSNRTVPTSNVSYYNHESWGTGFNIGALANLNFKEYLTLQPGLFYESRSGNYAYASEYQDIYNPLDVKYVLGHWRAYYFTVPVMGIVKFNLAPNIKISGEFGPYLQFQLKEAGKGVEYFEYLPLEGQYIHYKAKQKKVDIGLKMGLGFQFYKHYYIGIHYLAGLSHAWNTPVGGKNKSWMFTAGYDF